MGRRGILKEYATVFDLLSRVLDLTAVVLGALLAFWWAQGNLQISTRYQEAILLATVLSFIVFRWFALYQSWRGISLAVQLQRMTLAWGLVFVLLTLVAFFFKAGHHYSREWAVYWWLVSWTLLIASRGSARVALRWLRSTGANYRRVVIVGAGPLAAMVIRQLRESSWSGLRVVGVFDDGDHSPSVGVFNGVPVWGGLAEVSRYVEKSNVDQVWLCLPLAAEDRMNAVLHALRHSTVDVRFVPDIFGFQLLNHSLSDVAGVPVINLTASPLEGPSRLVKEIEDRLLALMILIVISPLMAIIALGVKLSSPGPVIFRQLRHGWDGQSIEVWKFRSMRVHAEDAGGLTQCRRHDPRVTRFGVFLRRTSLDELPQFFNVLQGRMSIVGPRPHAIEHNEHYKETVDQYMLRHKVKPGITGWAQVHGLRGETDTVDKMRKRVEYDLYYIQNWSLWLDLKIILLTLFRGFTHKNAY
jgi:putative colanic acid biosynthesis UDP-glucose lipid carrier transferase